MQNLFIITLFASIAMLSCKKTKAPEPAKAVTYTIAATAGANGSISPNGTIAVTQGSDNIYTITPTAGYYISSITVDGSSVPVTYALSNGYTFTNVQTNHTISVTFSKSLTVTATAGANGSVTPASVFVASGSSTSFSFTSQSGFHSDSLWIDGVFSKVLAGALTYTLTNVTADHSLKISFTDVLSQTQLDSLGNILAGKWHYVQYDYQYTGTIIWNIAPYLTDCEKTRYEVYTANHNYTYFLGGASCDPSYAPTNIYFNGTWKFDAAGKSILIAGNEYSNATTYQYVTGAYTVEKLTADSLVISYPVYGRNFSYRYHYAH